MGPPYATCTKAAALACLKLLCRHAQGAALLAAQTTAATATSASPRAAEAPAMSRQPTQEQDAAQQQQSEQSDSRQSPSMLKQVLLDLQAMASSIGCGHVPDRPTEGSSEGSSTASASGGDSQQREFVGMLDDAAGFADGLVAHLTPQQLLELPMVVTLQVKESTALTPECMCCDLALRTTSMACLACRRRLQHCTEAVTTTWAQLATCQPLRLLTTASFCLTCLCRHWPSVQLSAPPQSTCSKQ